MNKQIGIYGGTFDPIHLGHLNLAIQILEVHQLDEVWFCPAAINPFKMGGTNAGAKDRIEMIKLAIAGEPRFKITEVEIHRHGPSYTIDTLNQLITQSKHKTSESVELSLILGNDAALTFHQWHQPEEIIKCARLLIGQRFLNPTPELFKGSPEVVAALQRGLTPTKIMEISSTHVRQRLAKRLFCGHLLPGKVLDYILAHDLYLS